MKKYTLLVITSMLSIAACTTNDTSDTKGSRPSTTASTSVAPTSTEPSSSSTTDQPTTSVGSPEQEQSLNGARAFVQETLTDTMVSLDIVKVQDWPSLWVGKASTEVLEDLYTGPSPVSLNEVFEEVVPAGNSMCMDSRGVLWAANSIVSARMNSDFDAVYTWEEAVVEGLAPVSVTAYPDRGVGAAEVYPAVDSNSAGLPVRVVVPVAVEAQVTLNVQGTSVNTHIFIACSVSVEYSSGSWKVSSASSNDLTFFLPGVDTDGTLPMNSWVSTVPTDGLKVLPDNRMLVAFKATLNLI